MPAKIAASLTTAELAVLTVIARQVQRAGACVLPVDAIAALAGVSRTTVKRALRQAKLLGLLLVKERRIPGRKSLTNVVRVISPEWLGWLKLQPRGVGGQSWPATDSYSFPKRCARNANLASGSRHPSGPVTAVRKARR